MCARARRYTPPAFRQFTEAVVNLKFDEEPKYGAYVLLFEPLCGPGPQRPILLEDKARVGQKRGRDALEEDMEIVRSTPPAHPFVACSKSEWSGEVCQSLGMVVGPSWEGWCALILTEELSSL
jgi:hypothetical protein